MTLVAGVDCSTQSTKVVVCDAPSGTIVRSGHAPHPDATEVDPAAWLTAFNRASNELLDGVSALSIAGQQHGMVLTDAASTVIRNALLWNDNRSATASADLVSELGGPAAWAKACGSVPLASFTVTKLRWVAEHEPDVAQRADAVMLPHDWMTHRLRADPAQDPTTDRGDASGTGYYSAAEGRYRDDIVRLAFGRDLRTPRVADPAETVGETAGGIILGPGTGDNMGAALGLDLQPGDVVVSLGTSGAVFGIADSASHDDTGIVAGFADATGHYLPLVCTLNAARVLQAAMTMSGGGLETLDAAALSVPSSEGLTLLPFLDGERTPPLPDARGILTGLTRANMTPAHLARAAIEGMLCGLADAIDPLRDAGIDPRRVILIGGATRSRAVRQIAASLFGLPILVPQPGEYVALGAARQASWTLSGSQAPPRWGVQAHELHPHEDAVMAARDIRDRYREVLEAADPLLH